MSYEVHVDDATGTAHVTIRGAARLPELVEAVAALAPEGKYFSHRRLWDLRQMITSIIPEELELLARSALSRDTLKHARVAIVAGDDLAFRLSQLFEQYRQSTEVSVRAFRDHGEALHWLEA